MVEKQRNGKPRTTEPCRNVNLLYTVPPLLELKLTRTSSNSTASAINSKFGKNGIATNLKLPKS